MKRNSGLRKPLNVLFIGEPLHGLDTFKFYVETGIIKGIPGFYYVLDKMLKRKWNVHFILRTSENIQETIFSNLKIYPGFKKNFFMSKNFWGQVIQSYFVGKAIIKKNKIDVIYAGRPYGNIVGYLLSKTQNLPMVARIYGSSLYHYFGTNKLKMLFKSHKTMAELLIHPDVFIITQDGTYVEKLKEIFKLPNSRTFIWFNGYEPEPEISQCRYVLDSFFKNNPKLYEFLKKFKSYIFWVGRVEGWKRPEIAISVMERLVNLNNSIGMLIIGYGRDFGRIKNLVNSKKLAENIYMAGRINRDNLVCLMRYYCDIYVSFYDMSNLSTTLIEAMSNRCVPVVLNKGNMSILIQNFENGILIEEDDINKTHIILNDIVTNKDLMEKIKKNAIRTIRSKLQPWEKRIEKELQLVYFVSRGK